MLHAREDYQKIQQCDKPALRRLFEAMLNYIDKEFIRQGRERGVDVISDIRQEFEAAVAETIPSREPVFLVRAQDEVGAQTVRAWAYLHRANGGCDPLYESAMAHANLMEVWPVKKRADAAPKPKVEEPVSGDPVDPVT